MKQPRTSTTLTTLTLFTTFTLCLAGCSPNQLATSKAPSEELSYSRQPTPPTTTPNTPTTSTPSLSTSADVWQSFPPAPADEPDDITAIRKGWENHEQAANRVMKDPSIKDFNPLIRTTATDYGFKLSNEIGSMRDKGLKRQGNIRFRDVRISKPIQDEDGLWTATIYACRDVSHVYSADAKTGESVPPDAGNITVSAMDTVTDMIRFPNGSWVVSNWRGKASSC